MNKNSLRVIVAILTLTLFLNIFTITKTVNAYEQLGTMNVYKLRINLINIETTAYTIELIDGMINKTYEAQDGNEAGVHDFAIATELDEKYLENYSIKVKFEDGSVKDFDSIKVEKLVNIDDNASDSTYSYEYNLRVKFIPSIVIKIVIVVLIIALVVFLIMNLKKYKKRIK